MCTSTADCVFTCGSIPAHEVCSDGLDDDGDDDVDCFDSDCQVGSSYVSDAEALDVNCLGSPQTGDVERSWYCSVAQADESVGLCCQNETRPKYDFGFGWTCIDSEACYTGGTRCSYAYDSEFSSWISSEFPDTTDWCVAPADGRACCSVVHFASFEYWDDAATGNVKVY